MTSLRHVPSRLNGVRCQPPPPADSRAGRRRGRGSNFRNSFCAIVVIGSLASVPTSSGAQSARRDTIHTTVVGRHESADVYIDLPAADTVRREWIPSSGDAQISTAGRTWLRTVLPITVGGAAVPAGRYQVVIAGTATGADLLLLPDVGVTADAFAAVRGSIRVPLLLTRNARDSLGTRVAIKATRHGSDTLTVVDRSTSQLSKQEVQISPASTFTLMLWIGDALFTVPMAAR